MTRMIIVVLLTMGLWGAGCLGTVDSSVNSDADSGDVIMTGSDGNSDADADTDADSDADGDADSDGDADADGDADSDTDGDADNDTDADLDSDTDSDSDTDADSDSDTDSGPNNDSTTAAGTDTAPGTDAAFEKEIIIQENNPGFCFVDGFVESDNTGFTGAGYVNTDNAEHAGISWQIHTGVAADYTFEWRYALDTGNRDGRLSLNDTEVEDSIEFPETGAWTTWETVSVPIFLDTGHHNVHLQATGVGGLANIDSFIITGPAIAAGTCDGDTDTDTDSDADTDTDTDADTDADGDTDTDADGDADGDGCFKPTGSADGFYQMEDLNRGVVAVRAGSGNFVSWRMMGYEYNREDPESVAYNLYRDGTLVTTVTDSTNYNDAGGGADSTYSVSAVIDGTECTESEPVGVWGQNYLRIPLDSPGAHEANDGVPGDLDGDGEYEIVLKWQPNNAKDNSHSGVTDNTYLDGIRLDGTRLWRIDLGRNIRSGAHYTQHSVYDFDGDGRAEVAVKTAPGTKDGTGAYLSTGPAADDDDSADYRNGSGYVLSGPEYLTVFDGETGAELATIEYPVPRGKVSDWGDDYGNRLDRYNGGASFVSDTGNGLDATGRPSIIKQRGYYTRLTISAINWRDNNLDTIWIYDSDKDPGAYGQGNHTLMTADANGDGPMELIPGSATINSDGTFRCSTDIGHGDALHVSELIVGQGIWVFMPHEGAGGHDCHSADTCEFAFNVTGGDDNGRGVAEFVSESNTSSASCSSGVGSVNCKDGNGNPVSAGSNFLIYWDGDDVRELLDKNTVSKAGAGNLLSAEGCSSNNGTKSTPTLTADLLGDWREELVLRESDNSALRVYTTTDITARRMYTLMHDPTYRMQVTFEQSSYNQPPHVGFHIGAGMADPPTPDIHVK